MRNLQRWSLILACAVGIFGCTQRSSSSFKPDSEPDGFAGMKWSAEFSEVKSDMVESRNISNPAAPEVKIKIYYTRKLDPLRMGEVRLEKIEYGFWKGKFADVQMTAKGPENFNHLKKTLFEKYGIVDKSARGAYTWDGSVTQIDLRYDEPTQTASVIIASTRIANQEIQEMVDQD